jgi:hypothetical protein
MGVKHGWKVVKTHDLNRLLAAACEFNAAFSEFAPAFQNLTEQFWEQHYPGGDLDEVGDGYLNVREKVEEMVLIVNCGDGSAW